jgi:hypothetical protein
MRYQFDLSPVAINDTNNQLVLTVLETLVEIYNHIYTKIHRANLYNQYNADTY